MKKNILLVLTLVLITIFPSAALAQESTGSSGFKMTTQVDHIANIFERLEERVNLFFKFSKEDKAKYYQNLVEKRLAELVYVVDSGQGDMIEETSSRYSTYLGKFSKYIIDNKITDKKNELLIMYKGHIDILSQLQRDFEFGSGLWRLIEYDIDTGKIFSEQLQKI